MILTSNDFSIGSYNTSDGDYYRSDRIITDYIPYTFNPKAISVNVRGGGNFEIVLFLYSNDKKPLHTDGLGFYSNPASFDVSPYKNPAYFRVICRYSNNASITPSSISECVVSEPWIMKNGFPVPASAPDLPEKAATEPFPVSLWRVDKNKNGGYPFTGLMILTEPKGAFRKAEKLERVYIPESVKRIGAEAFRYTALKTVRIAPDCEYSPTSFPEGCEVEFYGGGGDYGQLYDSDGYAVLDCEAARIYVKE